MKAIYPSRDQAIAMRDCTDAIAKAMGLLEQSMSELALAGVGTYSTEEAYTKLNRTVKALRKLHLELTRKKARGAKNAPSYFDAMTSPCTPARIANEGGLQ